jgi:hypothetical protein
MGIHLLAAETAFSAGGDAGNQNMVAFFVGCHSRADGLDNAHTFMSENASGGAGWHVTFQNMQVCPADRGFGNAHNRVSLGENAGNRALFNSAFMGSEIDKGFHGMVS